MFQNLNIQNAQQVQIRFINKTPQSNCQIKNTTLQNKFKQSQICQIKNKKKYLLTKQPTKYNILTRNKQLNSIKPKHIKQKAQQDQQLINKKLYKTFKQNIKIIQKYQKIINNFQKRQTKFTNEFIKIVEVLLSKFNGKLLQYEQIRQRYQIFISIQKQIDSFINFNCFQQEIKKFVANTNTHIFKQSKHANGFYNQILLYSNIDIYLLDKQAIKIDHISNIANLLSINYQNEMGIKKCLLKQLQQSQVSYFVSEPNPQLTLTQPTLTQEMPLIYNLNNYLPSYHPQNQLILSTLFNQNIFDSKSNEILELLLKRSRQPFATVMSENNLKARQLGKFSKSNIDYVQQQNTYQQMVQQEIKQWERLFGHLIIQF